jgi:hypothetical protein
MTWKAFLQRRSEILEIDPAAIERVRDLGQQLAFRRSAHAIKAVQAILNEIDPEIGHLAPDALAIDISQRLEELKNYLLELVGFNPGSQNAGQVHSSLEDRTIGALNGLFPLLASLAALSASSSHRRQALDAAVSDAAKAFEEKSNNLSDILGERIAESIRSLEEKYDARAAALGEETRQAKEDANTISAILEGARKASAELSTSAQAKYFENEAGEYKENAKRWLIAAILGVILLLGMSVFALCLALGEFYKGKDAGSLTQITLAKLVLLGIVGYATMLSARNYFANRHNQAVNQHRANAISSYRALVEGVSSVEHRDIVLAQAASAVFAPQDTAFVKQAPQPSDVPTTIINSLAKGATP